MLKTANQKIAVFLFLFSIFYLIMTFNLPSYPYVPVDSDVIPMGLGILLMILSAALYFVKEKSEASKEEHEKIPGKEKLMLLGVLGIILLYIFLLEPLGFILSTLLFIFGCSRLLGYKNYILNGVVSIIFPLVVYFAFTKGLQVALPSGILPF
ncbi:tripartite tricarboxylate transporter TctB family protein [Falsibacillus albus]|uniref:Tripartite tricarboxylate transporter TctB family protein n=1 Tax=Falsibacillus albus TaxID=2478915 RepID=A0A3L7JZK5_9BACI|nr:tripartite tricarboxylate transporter TctB family protein [Falsibacillus albus]RLQ93812.1 tripartite tricarboxylate transporter TctB family protein [Falsibacillus albus]